MSLKQLQSFSKKVKKWRVYLKNVKVLLNKKEWKFEVSSKRITIL